jgi:Uncharacterised nucleotidyltransferase
MKLALPPSLWPTLHQLATGEPWPPPSDTAADRLVTRANTEALLPLLFDDLEVPAVVRAALDRIPALQRINARRSDILQAAARRVAEILRGEPFVFLKGVDYGHRLYADPVLRPMQDIDILVPRPRMGIVAGALQRSGLTLVPRLAVWAKPPSFSAVAELASHHEQLFRLGDVSVDVHHSFVQRSRNRVDYEAVWDRKLRFDAPGLAGYRLADTDALVYHALSLAAEEFSVPLLRYLDLWLMVRAEPSICEAAAQRAREWDVERALYGALRLASRFLPELADLGPGRAMPSLLKPSARRFLDQHVLPDPWEHGDGREPRRIVQVFRKLCLIDGFRHRATFGLYHAYALARGQFGAMRHRAHPTTRTIHSRGPA